MAELVDLVREIEAAAEPLRAARDKVLADAEAAAAPIRAKIDEIDVPAAEREMLVTLVEQRREVERKIADLRSRIREARARSEPLREVIEKMQAAARNEADVLTTQINTQRDKARPLKDEMVRVNAALGGATLKKAGGA